MFHHFGWKLPIQGQFLRDLGVNRCFSFYNPKAIKRQNITRGLFSTLVGEKNNEINKKVTQKAVLHSLPQKSPVNELLPNLEETLFLRT